MRDFGPGSVNAALVVLPRCRKCVSPHLSRRKSRSVDSKRQCFLNAGRDPAPTHNLVTGQGLLVDGIAPAVCHRMGRHRGLRGPRAARGSCQRDGPINSPVLFNQRFICFFFLQRFEVESLRPRRQRGIWFELGGRKKRYAGDPGCAFDKRDRDIAQSLARGKIASFTASSRCIRGGCPPWTSAVVNTE